MQASPLPVVYKLLTADIKAAHQVAIQMLTFLCQMGTEWQTQEQLALANFGNGVVLSNLVERLGAACNESKVSGAKAAELASLLQLLSSATAGRLAYTPHLRRTHVLCLWYACAVFVPIYTYINIYTYSVPTIKLVVLIFNCFLGRPSLSFNKRIDFLFRPVIKIIYNA